VVWGLGLARDAGADVNGNVIQRGQDYLRPRLVEHELAPNMQAWMLQALARSGGKAGPQEMKAMDNAFKQRERMSAYARALLTLAAKTWKHAELKTLADNLANGVRVDDAPDRSVLVHGASTAESSAPKIAWWDKERDFRYWHEGGIESTAFSLMALLETDPNNELVDAAALWLIKNRRGANWNNTKDTAIAVLAFSGAAAADPPSRVARLGYLAGLGAGPRFGEYRDGQRDDAAVRIVELQDHDFGRNQRSRAVRIHFHATLENRVRG
jgi:hypothetical protein